MNRNERRLQAKSAHTVAVGADVPASPSPAVRQALEQALRIQSTGDLTAAANIYKQILGADPNQTDALNLFGLLCYQGGNYEGAERLLKKAVHLNPRFVDALNHLGLVQQKLGRREDAAALFEQALAVAPDFILATLNLGNVCMEMRRFADAADRYKHALAGDPKLVAAHFNLGNAYMNLGRYEEAADAFRSALALAPDFAEAHGNLGVSLAYLDRTEEAIAEYLACLAVKPDFVNVHECLANAYRKQDRLEDAIRHYGHADMTTSRAKTMECLFALERYDDLFRELDSLAVRDPYNIQAAALSAFAAQQLGRPDPYNFCRNGLDYVREFRLDDDPTARDALVADLLATLEKRQVEWEPVGRTAIGGFQSPPDLFKVPQGPIAVLDRILKQRVAAYREAFADDTSDFIRMFPERLTLQGWNVRLKQGGAHSHHIHPDGWLSGVLYLKVPEHCAAEEGAIEFGLWGYEYPVLNDDQPHRRCYPEVGKIVLFPSSLFHHTIPFHSDEERIAIAFDLLPR